ncbi:MAG TPA: hypothetical protein VF979_10905 [Streptosporangiaceae bacterium]
MLVFIISGEWDAPSWVARPGGAARRRQRHYLAFGEIGARPLSKRLSISVIFLIYIVVGIIIAVSKHYITIGLLKVVGSALLAVFLWWLTLLGVNLHLH